MALIPDIQTCQWHHAREDFAAEDLLSRVPSVKGAIVETTNGKRVWYIWTRTFGDTQAENVLRLVIEDDTELDTSSARPYVDMTDLNTSGTELVWAAASVLHMAQQEAAKWSMKDVQLWNPTPFSVLAVRQIEQSARVIHREQGNIASLRWHGPESNSRTGVK